MPPPNKPEQPNQALSIKSVLHYIFCCCCSTASKPQPQPQSSVQPKSPVKQHYRTATSLQYNGTSKELNNQEVLRPSFWRWDPNTIPQPLHSSSSSSPPLSLSNFKNLSQDSIGIPPQHSNMSERSETIIRFEEDDNDAEELSESDVYVC